MAYDSYDYHLSHSQDDSLIDIPKWIDKLDDRLSSFIADGARQYNGKFTADELIQSANEYIERCGATMSDVETDLHNKGLAFIKDADTDEFTLSAFRRTSEITDPTWL